MSALIQLSQSVIIIRHALTVWNSLRLCQGWQDSELVSGFESDVISVAEELRLKCGNVGAIWSSDLLRAKRTAETLALNLGVTKIGLEPLFREQNFGLYEGRDPAQIEERQPELYDHDGFWYENIALYQGESLLQLRNRVRMGLKSVLEKCNISGILIIVAHAGSLAAAYSLAYDVPFKTALRALPLSQPLCRYVFTRNQLLSAIR